ncbi:hypothetical protein RJ640_030200 [Escallonia rubra]|uniref:Uncharacterized protein n=1 Tax=Escallonia rubra TaxID=112253 RepID=A0AA88RR34_9ASTE|nr:hypothetical protein RJ640_030200 [Escallonia rubra]
MKYRTLELNLIFAKEIKKVSFLTKMDVYAIISIHGAGGARDTYPTCNAARLKAIDEYRCENVRRWWHLRVLHIAIYTPILTGLAPRTSPHPLRRLRRPSRRSSYNSLSDRVNHRLTFEDQRPSPMVITFRGAAQTHDLQMIVPEIISKRIRIDQQTQVVAIINKLLKSWKEFQKGLCHKQSELSIVNLMVGPQIEKEARKQDKKNEP